MRTINTRQDVEDLLRDGTAPEALSKHVAEFLLQLEEELTDEEENAFRLDQQGPIALLEAGDDLFSLNFTEMNNESGDFLEDSEARGLLQVRQVLI